MKIQISLSAALKITKEDYAQLEKALKAVVSKHPEMYKAYKADGLSDMRYNWDVLHMAKYDVTPMYKYLNDDHINSAVAKILSNTGKSNKK